MWKGSVIILLVLLLQGLFLGGSAQEYVGYSPYDALSIPALSPVKSKRPILIAVVDDAFRLSHKEFNGLIYENKRDKLANRIDDDGNNKIDDFHGWDIADNDNDVNPPERSGNSFFHGTFVASTIINVLKECFADSIPELVKILPVKVLSDYSTLPDYSMGYKGIEYAIEQKADIICCAWSGGEPSADERDIVKRAIDQGILVVGSAGNAYSATADPPGSLDGVLTVSGIDSLLQKMPSSNYGTQVDLSAPAQNVKAAYPLADNSYFLGSGTSAAAGLVAGCAAVLKILNPGISSEEIKQALINTAFPLDKYNPGFSGRMGAGLPNVSDAVSYVEGEPDIYKNRLIERTKGQVNIDRLLLKSEWIIAPYGAYAGFNFDVKDIIKPSKKAYLRFYTPDSIWHESDLRNITSSIYVPGGMVKVEYERSKFGKRSELHLDFEAVPIDSSIVYCKDTRYYQIPEATITDGSDEDNYANNCSCKWQITAPEGTRIFINFDEFSTQAKTDFVYLFDGESTIPDNLIAKFSGPEIPMNVNSRSNKVLIWFVTDGSKTDKGWKLSYRFEDN